MTLSLFTGWSLRSDAKNVLVVPCMRGATQSRSFDYAGPSSWNHLWQKLSALSFLILCIGNAWRLLYLLTSAQLNYHNSADSTTPVYHHTDCKSTSLIITSAELSPVIISLIIISVLSPLHQSPLNFYRSRSSCSRSLSTCYFRFSPCSANCLSRKELYRSGRSAELWSLSSSVYRFCFTRYRQFSTDR